MSVRPSSSRGPSSKSSASSSFKYDKRISRDDSFVNLRAGPGAGFNPYTFARGQLPTPERSPRSSPRKAAIPAVRMPTPDSLNDGRFAEIGMALGSPTKPPSSGSRPPQASLRYRQASAPSIVSPVSRISTVESIEKPLPRKQSGKWKLFSRFGKKQSDHSHPEPHEQQDAPRSEQLPDIASQPWYDTKMERSHTVNSRGTARHKPIVVRSQTMPYDADSSAQEAKSKPHDRKTKETFGRIPIALDHKPTSSGPLLDVEIPDITMERYSVMFGSVLQPQHQPSLLARRQATMQKLKTIDDAIEKEEEEKHHYHIPRRATSPQPGTMSPSFALFPPNPPHRLANTPVSTASPRLRSNTSPALFRSPSKTTFEYFTPHQRRPSKTEPKIHNHKEPAVHPNQKGKLTIATLARAREQQAAAAARENQFSPDSSSLILESPTEMSSPEFEVVRSEAVRAPASYMQSPKWQMVTPPQVTPSTASTAMTSDRKPPPSSPASSAQSDLTGTSVDVDDDLLENSANMNPVELSIARQISVSRQQRKLLKPLQTGPTALRPRPSPSKTTPVPKIAMGKNERLAETKSSTPTLVTPEDSFNSPLAQHRKSERVVLERA
ncbi:hypothetical protein F4818DRAFT_152248 [Hypoxylon cercidicola]|nr:hypothetical protein F4818DRAFT_152248 [Hypoxylon cercidicola]